jgi:UBX domain-containing protein 1
VGSFFLFLGGLRFQWRILSHLSAGPAPSSQPQSGVFSGSAHTLGSDEVESQFIPDPTHPFGLYSLRSEHGGSSRSFQTIPSPLPYVISHYGARGSVLMMASSCRMEILPTIRFWPKSMLGSAFILSASSQYQRVTFRSRAPPHILNVLPGQPVDLRVAKRFKEKYQPPPKRAFAGAGNRLGAPVPTFNPGVPAAMPGEYPSTGVTSVPSGSNEAGRSAVSTKFEVDQEQPTTSLQIRLADGTRSVPPVVSTLSLIAGHSEQDDFSDEPDAHCAGPA